MSLPAGRTSGKNPHPARCVKKEELLVVEFHIVV